MNLHNEKEPTENMCLDVSCILREQLLCETQSFQEVFRIYPKELGAFMESPVLYIHKQICCTSTMTAAN